MDRDSIQSTVEEFLKENYLRRLGRSDLEPDEVLFENGVLDSLGVLELLSFLESHFKVVFSPDDLNWDSLASVNRITDAVSRLLKGEG